MKKTIFLLLVSFMISVTLTGCKFFELPGSGEPTDSPETTLEQETTSQNDAELSRMLSDEEWQALAADYVQVKETCESLRTVYHATSLVNPEVENLLAQADVLIAGMGETRRSQVTVQDATEMKELIRTMDTSMNELYQSISAANQVLNPDQEPEEEKEAVEVMKPVEEEPAETTEPVVENSPTEEVKPAEETVPEAEVEPTEAPALVEEQEPADEEAKRPLDPRNIFSIPGL